METQMSTYKEGHMSRVYEANTQEEGISDLWNVYRIHVPQHRENQGYIGVSKLSHNMLQWRYVCECYEAENPDYARGERRVYKMIKR